MSYAEVVYEYPAYKICKMFTRMINGTEIKVLPVASKVALMFESKRHGMMARQYSPGSVAAYAVKNNECPLEAVADAKAKGHALYWLNQCSVSITAWEKPQETIFEIKVGDKVWYMGKVFEIQYENKWSKEHLKLVEIEPAAADVAA